MREWLLWVVERERERSLWRQSISRWNREWSSILLPQRRVDPTHRCVLSLSSARAHLKTRSLALERSSSRVEWLMNDDQEGEALHSLVSLPWITQQQFVGMFQAKKNRPSWCIFPFRMATVLPLRTAWIAVNIFSQASLRDVQKTTLLQTWWRRRAET